MNVKPAIGFLTKDSDAQLDQDTETVIASMTGNANFPTPSPTLAVVTTALNAFTVALADAAGGGVEKTAIKNARRNELVSLLRQLSSYVYATANGDMTKLLSSGFPAQKTSRTPIGPLPTPDVPILSQGAVSGSLDAATVPISGAYIYSWRIALASAATTYIKQVQTTAANITFEGLTPGQVYLVEVNVIGTAGPTDWSGPGELMII
jgi:hypothetical protein